MRKQLRIVPRMVSAERVFAEQHGAQPASPLIRGLWFRVGTHYEWGLRLSVPYQPQFCRPCESSSWYSSSHAMTSLSCA
jgi:hypothetical protein